MLLCIISGKDNDITGYIPSNNSKCVLECLATGMGPIQYKWEKYQSSSNSWIRPSRRAVNITSPKLIFSVITEEDEGVYCCVTFNHHGKQYYHYCIWLVYMAILLQLFSCNASI